jgi:hypothetical protein
MVLSLLRGIFSPAIVPAEQLMPVKPMALTRRSFVGGLFAVPAVVSIGNIMPVKAFEEVFDANEVRFWVAPNHSGIIDTAVEYKNLDWVQIKMVEEIGVYDDPPISGHVINDGRTRMAKAHRDVGQLEVMCFESNLDRGQRVLEENRLQQSAFRVDVPGEGPSYFSGFVACDHRVATRDGIKRRAHRIAIDGAIIQGE